MLPENNMRRLVVRLLLCSLGLTLGFSILTSKASLQTQTTTANTKPTPLKPPTPRPTRRISNSNSSANRVTSDYGETNVMPMPTPPPPANSTIRGRVFYADTGRAIKRAPIMLMDENIENGPGSSPSAITDGEGYFQMKNVRAGTYYALVNAPGVVSPLAFFDFSAAENRNNEKAAFEKAFVGFEKIFVDGITSIDIQVSAQRGGAIGGRITYDDGDAAIGVRVEILRKVDDRFTTVIPNLSAMFSMRMSGVFQTDDRGVYRFAGLPAGEYIVKVTESASHSELSQRTYYDPFDGILNNASFLTLYYPDVFDSKSAQLINVAAGQEISEINLTIPSRNLYKLEGKVVAAKDKSTVKARITINRESDDTFSIFSSTSKREQAAMTDEDGNWKFKELPKGTYKIVVEPVDSENTYQNYLGNYSYANTNAVANRTTPPKPKFAKKALEMTIEDKDLSEIIVEVGFGATISGSVTVEKNEEMPKSLTIYALNETDKLSVTDTISNYYSEKIERDFKLESVTAGKNRFFVSTAEEDFYVKSAAVNGIDLLASTFEVKEGEFLRNVQVVLSTDVGILKGTVSDDAKEPVKGASFTLVPVDAARRKNSGFYRNIRSDKEGKFETKLAPGEYAIVIFDERAAAKNQGEFLKWLDTAIKDAQKVKIEAGQAETVTIKKSK